MKRGRDLWVMVLLGLMVLAIAVERPGAETTQCTVVPSLPYIISTQGIYCLKTNLSTSITAGNAITIATNNVVLDLNGYKVGGLAAGPGTAAYGIYAFGRQNITIRNGTVRGFYVGIYLDDSLPYATSQGNIIEDIRADMNTFVGIYACGRGNIFRNNQIVSTGASTVTANNTAGIVAWGPGGSILDNSVYRTVEQGPTGTSFGINISLGSGTVVENNRVGNDVIGLGVSNGIYIQNSLDVLISNNRITTVSNGIFYTSGSTGKYRDNLTSNVTVSPYWGGTDAGNNN